MIDYQRTAEFLRDFRATPGQPVTDEVRRYATEYAQYLTQANERLRQCSVLLQQGLRSEAIHLADETPNLLELVAALDLPDPQGWNEFCQQHDLPAPPPLQIERATRLNDAYGQEQPVESLLRRHRRFALSRAPIKQRLETMRQIAAADPSSGFWEKDIRVFEKARMKELKVAFAAAMDARDSNTVNILAQEVLKSNWLEPVSPDLQAAAQGADDRLKLLLADQRLRQLLEQIREAYKARNHSACAALVRQIPQIVAESNQPGVSVETAAELKPILAWVRQEDEILQRKEDLARAQRALSEALDADLPETQLESLYQKLRAFNEPIPPELEDRYQLQARARRRAAQRRFAVMLAGVAAVLTIGILLIYHFSRSNLAAGWADRIHRAAVARDRDTAQHLIDDQEKRAPQFNNDPRVAAAKREVAELVDAFNNDRKSAETLIAAMEQDVAAAEKMINNADARIEELLNASRVADEASKKADNTQRLAWVDPEQKIQGAQRRLKTQSGQLADAAEHKARARADSLAEKIDRLSSPATTAPSMQETLQSLDAISAELESLRNIAGISKETLAQVAAMGEKITAKRAALGKNMEQTQNLAALRQKATSVAGWKKALQDFVAAYPDLPQTKDFTRAIETLDAAAALESLQALQQSWSNHFDVRDETDARARLEKIKAYATACPRSPYRAAIDNYAKYLDQAANALAVKGSWQQGFHELLSSPLICELKVLNASNGTRYYVMGDIKMKTSHIADSELTTFEAIDPANLTRRKTITLFTPIKELPVALPHTKFAESLSARLRQVSAENWDSFGISLIDEIAHEKEMDPVVRAIFLQQAIQSSVQIAGWGLGDLYTPAVRSLARYEVENIAWYDLSKPVPDATILALKQIADGLPKPDAAQKALRDAKAKLFSDAACSFVAVGALMHNDAGAWTIFTAQTPASGMTAWAVGPLPAAATEPAPLIKVAHYEGDKCIVDETAAAPLPEGTFVFIRK